MKNHRTLRNLLMILAIALLNCLLEGTVNLVVELLILAALVPTVIRIDRELQN